MDFDPSCRFCQIIAAREYAESDRGIVSFAPLHPVRPGHLLIVPRRHVVDALEDARLTGRAVEFAARMAAAHDLAPCNIMTNVGADACQRVFHLHWHIIPRSKGDGLMLPWTETQAIAAGALA